MSIDFDPTKRVRRDPGPTNIAFFGFGKGTKPPIPPEIAPRQDVLFGRPGHTERAMHLTYHTAPDSKEPELVIRLAGWFVTTCELNDRQMRHLRDTLNTWLD